MGWEMRAQRRAIKWGDLGLTTYSIDLPIYLHSENLDLEYHLMWSVLRAWLISLGCNWGEVNCFPSSWIPGLLSMEVLVTGMQRLLRGRCGGQQCLPLLYSGPLCFTQQWQAWSSVCPEAGCFRRCWLLLPPGDTHDFLGNTQHKFLIGLEKSSVIKVESWAENSPEVYKCCMGGT